MALIIGTAAEYAAIIVEVDTRWYDCTNYDS